MTESYRDRLNEIDHKCLDENLKFYDLRSLFESVAPKLSAEDKEEIKKVIQNTNDAEIIAAVLQAKAVDEKNESLEEKLVDAPQEVVDELLDILGDHGFILDNSFKVNPGKTFMGETHIQVINPDSFIEYSDEISTQDQLQKYVTRDLIDEIHKLDRESNCPITWNFGPNENGQVTGGLDIMKQWIEESFKTRRKNYCPHCTNNTLIEIEDGYYVCDECGAEYTGYPSFEGGLELTPVEDESLNEAIDAENIEFALKNVLAVYVVDNAKTSPVIYTEELDNIENTKTDNPINVNPTMVAALLSGLQKCDSIYVEPTPKNREFMREYNLKPDDYVNIFNQIRSSDFVKALHSNYPKYEDDLLFVFQSSEIKLTDQVADLEVYIKVNISKSDQDSVIAISFHKLNQFESLDEASYGGAYDVEDDMYFTRDDLYEFLDKLIDKLDNHFGYSFDVYDSYFDSPTHLYIELIDEVHDININYSFKIDMRKIKKPSDLQRYIPQAFEYFVKEYQNEYDEYNFDESLNEEKKRLNNREKKVYIDIIKKAEDREDLEDIVHEIFFYDKALFAMMNKFPKNASFEELKANKIAILKDSMLTEDYQHDKDEWGEPYSYDEVERELKSITDDWSDEEGTIRCYWEQEKNYGLQILKKHYKYVETSDGRTGKGEDMSWVLAYSKPKEIFDESLNESVTSQLQDKIIDCLDWFILMEMEFPKGKFLADSWEDVKDGIQMGIDPEFEVAEGIVEYLKPIITFNKRYNKEVEEEGVFQDEIEMYQSLVRAMNNYLAKNGYEERIEE